MSAVAAAPAVPAPDTPAPVPSAPVRPEPSRRRSRPGEASVAFLASLTAYLSLGWWFLTHGVIFPDSVSRVANASYVLYSRDPHLPAIGFVWNPLPSFLLLPVLPLRGLFPVLTRDGFAGPVESAVFMAGAVVLLLRLLRVLGVGPGHRWTLTVLFALHPMTAVYGASGESEGMLLFFTLLTANGLAGWLADGAPGRLVGIGLALGGAYLTRYEAVAPAAAVVLLVAALSFARTPGPRRLRAQTAVNDALLAGLPFLLTFAGWALAGRVLVGSWFPTLSSTYGNSSQVGNERTYIQDATGHGLPAMTRYAADQLLGLQPFVAVLLVLAAVVAVRRRQWAALAAPVVLGAVLGFDDLAFLSGTSFGWLRFQIAVVPLGFVLAGTVLARPTGPTGPTRPARVGAGPRPRPGRLPAAVVPIGILALVAVSLPVSALTLADHRLAREETATVLAAVDPARATAADRQHLLVFRTEHGVADDLDALHLPEGAVLTDAASSFGIVLASADPRQFVITSDLDFAAVLARPAAHHVRFLLVPDPAAAPHDALVTAYPRLYATGAGMSTLVRTWPSTSSNEDWRLYRLD